MTEMTPIFKKEFFLEKDGQIEIPITYLPEGDFVYPVTAINPSLEEIELSFLIKSNNCLQSKKKVRFSSDSVIHSFNFSTFGECWDSEIILSVSSGSKVWLHIPVSPRLLQKIESSPSTIKETVIKIISEIEREEGETDEHSLKNSFQQASDLVVESNPVNSLEASHFKGLVNLEQAQKQLDYVIYNKFLRSEGLKGFAKWKRSIYRKIVIHLYKKLSKNPSRRGYFVKLYRNYVNNNIIAENLQAV